MAIEESGDDPDEILDFAERLCEEADLEDLAVELTSIRALAHLTRGEPRQAMKLARNAVSRITPGVERPYLLHHRLALAAEAIGEIDEARSASLVAEKMLRAALAGLDPEDFDRAVRHVPEHEAIVSRAERFGPRVIEMHLPTLEAPTGRALEKDDLRVVQWTVEHPDDERHDDGMSKRRARLVRLVHEANLRGTAPTTEHLAEALGVSASTIRRDLGFLRADGHSLRTRGQRKTG